MRTASFESWSSISINQSHCVFDYPRLTINYIPRQSTETISSQILYKAGLFGPTLRPFLTLALRDLVIQLLNMSSARRAGYMEDGVLLDGLVLLLAGRLAWGVLGVRRPLQGEVIGPQTALSSQGRRRI